MVSTCCTPHSGRAQRLTTCIQVGSIIQILISGFSDFALALPVTPPSGTLCKHRSAFCTRGGCGCSRDLRCTLWTLCREHRIRCWKRGRPPQVAVSLLWQRQCETPRTSTRGGPRPRNVVLLTTFLLEGRKVVICYKTASPLHPLGHSRHATDSAALRMGHDAAARLHLSLTCHRRSAAAVQLSAVGDGAARQLSRCCQTLLRGAACVLSLIHI